MRLFNRPFLSKTEHLACSPVMTKRSASSSGNPGDYRVNKGFDMSNLSATKRITGAAQG